MDLKLSLSPQASKQGKKAAERLKADGAVSEIKLQDGVAYGADAQRVLENLAKDGWNPIIAHSFNYGDDVKARNKPIPIPPSTTTKHTTTTTVKPSSTTTSSTTTLAPG